MLRPAKSLHRKALNMMNKKEIQDEREDLLTKSREIVEQLKKDIVWLEEFVLKNKMIRSSPFVFDISKRITSLEAYIIQDSVLEAVQKGRRY